MNNEPIRWGWREWWKSPETVLIRLVLYIFAVLSVIYVLMPKIDSEREPRKKVALFQVKAFVDALNMFRQDTGRFPTTSEGLGALMRAPLAVTNWQQYLDNIPLDPWQHPYRYECPGKHLTNSFDLYSSGPDGRAGTDDDIANWNDFSK